MAESSSLVGIGITMEGIWQNYPLYEMTLQQAWHSTPVPPSPPPPLRMAAAPTAALQQCRFGENVTGQFLAGYPPSMGCNPLLPKQYGCDP